MRRTTTKPPPMLTVHNVQSSTSPTAQRRAPRPRCGRSSDKLNPVEPKPPNQRQRTPAPFYGSAPARTAPCLHYYIGHELEEQRNPRL